MVAMPAPVCGKLLLCCPSTSDSFDEFVGSGIVLAVELSMLVVLD